MSFNLGGTDSAALDASQLSATDRQDLQQFIASESQKASIQESTLLWTYLRSFPKGF